MLQHLLLCYICCCSCYVFPFCVNGNCHYIIHISTTTNWKGVVFHAVAETLNQLAYDSFICTQWRKRWMYEIYDNMILRFNLRKHNLTTVYVLSHINRTQILISAWISIWFIPYMKYSYYNIYALEIRQ